MHNPLTWIDPLGLYTYNTMPGIEGFQKHHIIPQQLKNHPLMQASGMNIHDSKNIIYLPTDASYHPIRSVHRGSHPVYTAEIDRKMTELHGLGQKRNWSQSDYRRATEQLMADERKKLRAGTTQLRKISKK